VRKEMMKKIKSRRFLKRIKKVVEEKMVVVS
jgi:hypothetical protein